MVTVIKSEVHESEVHKGRVQMKFVINFFSASEWGGGISTQKVFIVNFSLLNGHFYQKNWAKCMKNEVVVVVGDKSKKNYCAFFVQIWDVECKFNLYSSLKKKVCGDNSGNGWE